jgi:hypothetical protein
MSLNITKNVYYTYRYLALLMRSNNMNVTNFPRLTKETGYDTHEIYTFMKHPAIKDIVPEHSIKTLEEHAKYWEGIYINELNKLKNKY